MPGQAVRFDESQEKLDFYKTTKWLQRGKFYVPIYVCSVFLNELQHTV